MKNIDFCSQRKELDSERVKIDFIPLIAIVQRYYNDMSVPPYSEIHRIK